MVLDARDERGRRRIVRAIARGSSAAADRTRSLRLPRRPRSTWQIAVATGAAGANLMQRLAYFG
jgi:hypothetical protein